MKVLAVTGSRADWGLLAPVLGALREDDRFTLQIAVTGQHLHQQAPTESLIAEDGFSVDYRFDMELGEDDSVEVLGRGMGLALGQAAAVLSTASIDVVLVLGDRYEILAVASAALLARVPVAHLCGGDVTEGAFDDAIRHAVTKLSAVHFVSNADARRRLIQMGETPAMVHNVGSTGLDRVLATPPLPRTEFFASVGLEPGVKNFVVTFHPPTLAVDALQQCDAVLEALGSFPGDIGLIFTGSNSDPGGRAFERRIQDFVSTRERAVFHSNLGSKRYFSALTHVDVVVGNSSSGLYEAPSFNVPTVNIGDRQARRLRADSVIDCAPDVQGIRTAIEQALSLDCVDVINPYGDGQSAPRIVGKLSEIGDPTALCRKSFNDLESPLCL